MASEKVVELSGAGRACDPAFATYEYLATCCTECKRHAMDLVFGRAELYQGLRAAKSWNEVLTLLKQSGYDLGLIEGVLFASNNRSGLAFSLVDCGHNLQVFEERLGPLPCWMI